MGVSGACEISYLCVFFDVLFYLLYIHDALRVTCSGWVYHYHINLVRRLLYARVHFTPLRYLECHRITQGTNKRIQQIIIQSITTPDIG